MTTLSDVEIIKVFMDMSLRSIYLDSLLEVQNRLTEKQWEDYREWLMSYYSRGQLK